MEADLFFKEPDSILSVPMPSPLALGVCQPIAKTPQG
jgi:hypothetical protein